MSTTYNRPGSPVLHTKGHGHRSTDSKEEDFEAFYHIGVWRPSGHVANIILTYFHFHVPKSLHTKFGLKRSRGF